MVSFSSLIEAIRQTISSKNKKDALFPALFSDGGRIIRLRKRRVKQTFGLSGEKGFYDIT